MKGKYDWKKTLKKAGVSAGVVVLAGLASVYGDSSWWLSIVPLFTIAQNWLKHRNK